MRRRGRDFRPGTSLPRGRCRQGTDGPTSLPSIPPLRGDNRTLGPEAAPPSRPTAVPDQSALIGLRERRRMWVRLQPRPRHGRFRAAGLVEDVSAQSRPTPKRTSNNVPNSGCIIRRLRASSGRRPMRRMSAVRHDGPRIRTSAHASPKPCGRSPAGMRVGAANCSISSAIPCTEPADLRDGTEGLRTAPHSGQRTLRPPPRTPPRRATRPFDNRGERDLRGVGCPRRRSGSPP